MSDFTALLKQSILERGIGDAGERAGIYAQARSAMIRRLWSFEPPLGEGDIDVRIAAFDRAVAEIEEDLRAAFVTGDGSEVAEANEATEVDGEPPERIGYAAAEGETEARSYPPYDASGADQAPWRPDYEAERGEIGETRVERAGRYADPESEYDAPGFSDDRNYDDRTHQQAEERDAFPPLDAGEPKPSPIWSRLMPASERDKIRLLVVAIAALVLILLSLGIFMILPGGAELAESNGSVRREASDPAAAARIPTETLDVAQSFVVFDGRDPTVFEGTSTNPIRFDGDADGGFAVVSSSSGAAGAKALIGPGLATRLAGKRIRVTLVARAARENGATGLRFAYQSGLAISHWQSAELSEEFVSLGMIWRVPTLRTNPAGDFLLIEPGIPGDGTRAEIKSIRIEMLVAS